MGEMVISTEVISHLIQTHTTPSPRWSLLSSLQVPDCETGKESMRVAGGPTLVSHTHTPFTSACCCGHRFPTVRPGRRACGGSGARAELRLMWLTSERYD